MKSNMTHDFGVVAPSGNLVISGDRKRPVEPRDLFTAQCTPSGGELWTTCFEGTGSALGHGTALTTDGLGNVYITGSSTAKYRAQGQKEWSRLLAPTTEDSNAAAVSVDGDGNVYVGGQNIEKYDDNGQLLWSVDAGNVDVVDLLADDAGTVYITGRTTHNPGVTDDIATFKLNANGDKVWERIYNGPLAGIDYPVTSVLDRNGDVVIAGDSEGIGTQKDYVIIKYAASSGAQLWLNRFNGPQNGDDEVAGLAVDSENGVYVSGSQPGTREFLTVKYDQGGVITWLKEKDIGTWNTRSVDVEINANDQIYVLGHRPGTRNDGSSHLVKYTVDGEELWAADVLGAPVDLGVDGQGNAYVLGYRDSEETGRDVSVVSYSPVGAETESFSYNNPGNRDDFPVALTVDKHDNIAVLVNEVRVPSSFSNPKGYIMTVIRYVQASSTAPQAPQLVLPLDDANNVELKAQFVWNSTVGADFYHVQIASDSLFSELIQEFYGVTQTTKSADLSSNTAYFWRVAAVNAGGLSTWSEHWQFTTAVQRPSAPILLSPDANETGVSITPTFMWRKADLATSYVVHVDDDSVFVTPEFAFSVASDTSIAWNSETPLANTTRYFWRVRSENDDGAGVWSPVRAFTTETPTGVDENNADVPAEFALFQNYPNPFNPATTIKYAVAKRAHVSLTVFNIRGEVVDHLVDEMQEPGVYSVIWRSPDTASGVYFAKLEAQDFRFVMKLTLIR